ncbi:MAG: hypothetical protein KA717_33180 [Woronichinia naegeliana WA131]|uniref:Uncharacterized protein n=2 Tax=Woronichinia naegeliana WA131 TaxID=2824559 RepID=A0A977PUV0_9CYAN|nr:MAG: hypothetical protein KA717_33180 [Woronichinia naegeliana WA131]
MKSDKEETMMTAKLINVEGSKIKIELTLELSRSMLDTEINIQKGLNEGVRPLVDKSCCNQGSTGNPY